MYAVNENVSPIGINYISEYYEAFLNKFSKGTAVNYKTDINLFFKEVYKQSPEHVTIEDIRNTKMIDTMNYYKWLTEMVEKKGVIQPRYKNNSVNRKLNAIKSFFRFLNADFEDINDNVFRNCESKNPELDSQSWDGLDWQEAIQIWEYAQDNFGKESNQLSMLFKLASVTSVRLDALMNSEWEKHWFVKKEHGTVVNFIEVEDKGKKHKKPISEAFYNELREKLGTSGKLFPNMYPKKIRKCLRECITALGFDPRRNIKFHSFKKAGVMRALEKTGNMYKAKEQGNHSSINTAEKYYLKYKECLVDMTSYTMDSEIDVEDELSDYSKEELVEAIDKMSDGAKYELLRMLKG